MMRIYNTVHKAGPSWDDVKAIGSTNLRRLCAKIEPENLQDWIEPAQNMTVAELDHAIKIAKDPDADTLASSPTGTLVFKPHKDQLATITLALDRAKAESGTEVNTVALEYICLDYIAGTPTKSEKDNCEIAE